MKPGNKVYYLIYRAEGKKSGQGTVCNSKYKKVSRVSGSTTSYTDWAVRPNRIYCYKITTVVGKHESSPTEVVTAVIPGDN